MMDVASARQALMRHSGLAGPVELGFLAMFRPYRGLDEERFLDVMRALETVAPTLAGQLTVETDLVNALWRIATYTSQWVLEPDGMLRRNHLITDEDLDKVRVWMSLFSWTVADLLQGVAPAAAFRRFREAYPG